MNHKQGVVTTLTKDESSERYSDGIVHVEYLGLKTSQILEVRFKIICSSLQLSRICYQIGIQSTIPNTITIFIQNKIYHIN